MNKYYKTLKTSETGRKFQAIEDKAKVCRTAQVAMAEKYGFTKWRSSRWAAYGGISSVVFENEPDKTIWKREGRQEYSPRCNIKAGKDIQSEFDALPTIDSDEVNACIGYDECMSTIGVQFGDGDFFGFSIDSDAFDDIPADCIEITGTEYEKL